MNKNIKSGIYTKQDKGESTMIPFNFSTNLRAIDKIRFVNNVTNLIVADNFNIIIKDMLFDYQIIDIFTDIDLTPLNNAQDSISAIEDFLVDTNIVEIVVANMEDGLLDELKYCVNKNIDYQTGIHDNSLTELFSELIKTITKKIENININELVDFVSNVSKMTGEVTPDKLVEAYTKTDAFQKNQLNMQKEQKRHNKKLESVARTVMEIEREKQKLEEGSNLDNKQGET